MPYTMLWYSVVFSVFHGAWGGPQIVVLVVAAIMLFSLGALYRR